MTRVRLLLAALALAATACDRTDPATAPLRTPPPHALPTVNVLTVSNTNDNGDGSLRKAIADAQAGDVIHFADAIAGQTITLTSGQLVVDKLLTIEGSATAGMTISGGGNSRVVSVAVSGDVTIRNLTIADGLVIDGGAGGGILNLGKLAIENSTIANNIVDFEAVAASGGGIYNAPSGILKLVNSTVSGNRSVLSNGGGIDSFGALTLIHTTIANNAAGGTGGGFGAFDGTLLIRNSIIGDNDSGGTSNDACRLDTDDVDWAALGTNIIDQSGCITDVSVIVADPLLGDLANNGGPTKTHALLVNSPAIDALADCLVAEDQRHVARPQGAACDVGAYEFTDYLKTPIAVNEGVAVNPSTGVAIVTGTLSCTSPIDIPLHVELSQPQKSGRATVTAKATGDIVVSCASVKAWSISLAPPTGAFINGPGTAFAKTTPPNSSVAQATTTAPVKLYWGRK